MKGYKKCIGVLFALLFSLISLVGVSSATPADVGYDIEYAKVNGIPVSASDPVFVEAGSAAVIEVFLKGINSGSYDSRVKVYIGGYEYGVIEDTSEIFEIESGVRYRKILKLDIPVDLEAGKDYTLNIEVFDDKNSIENKYVLRIQEMRHRLGIYDVVLSSTQIEAGKALFVQVRLENLGDNPERSVKITASIPSLGASASEYVDELEDLGSEDNENVATTSNLILFIPESAQEGNYEGFIKVEYNRGWSTVEKTFSVLIKGVKAPQAAKDGIKIEVDAENKRIEFGQVAVYAFTIANLGQAPVDVRFEVFGLDGSASVRIDPEKITVQADSTGRVNIAVSPRDEKIASKSFTVRATSNGAVIGEKQLGFELSRQDTGIGGAKKALEVVFLALVALLIIVIIVLVIKKIAGGNSEEADEEISAAPSAPKKGKSFY